MINLLIADDHTLFIEGLCALLRDEEDMHIMGIAHDGKALLEMLPMDIPGVVLLDINMPGLNGLETARYIKQGFSTHKVIMLSTYNDEHLVEKARHIGANGYLLKTTSGEELLQTIRLVAGGQDRFPVRVLKPDTGFVSDTFSKQFSLTKRETEILGFIKKELTNQQIADALFLSIYTVETHRKNIMHKLGLKTAVALHKFLDEHFSR